MEVKQTIFNILIIVIVKFGLHRWKIHRMMDDGKVIVELKTNMVYWFSELLTLPVLEQTIDDE